jgi:hypothetical protein
MTKIVDNFWNEDAIEIRTYYHLGDYAVAGVIELVTYPF